MKLWDFRDLEVAHIKCMSHERSYEDLQGDHAVWVAPRGSQDAWLASSKGPGEGGQEPTALYMWRVLLGFDLKSFDAFFMVDIDRLY